MFTKSAQASDSRLRLRVLLALGLAALLAFGLAGCGQTGAPSSQTASSSSTAAPTTTASASSSSVSAPSAAAASSASSSVEQEPAPSETTSSSQENVETMALGDYMRERWTSFEAFDEGIRSGANIPPSLRLFIQNEFDGSVHNKDAIAETWKALCDVRVSIEQSENPGVEDGFIGFNFDSYSEVVGFNFETTEFANPVEGEFFAVQDPAALVELVEKTRTFAQAEWDASGGLVNENGVYLWDADADGIVERMRIDFTDNGDEARSVMTFTLEKDGAEPTSVNVEGMYSVQTLTYAKDDAGPYLIMRYTEGDYYNHDTVSEGKLRLVDGVLAAELGN